VTPIITATAWITLGITGYAGDFVGSGLACGGTYTTTEQAWVAAPIEWMLGGWVSCGDRMEIVTRDGREIEARIMDTGCMLHYPVWDTGLPFGADLPRLLFPTFKTGTGQLRVWRVQQGRWWTPPPLTPWAIKWCDGPLSPRYPRWPKRHRPR